MTTIPSPSLEYSPQQCAVIDTAVAGALGSTDSFVDYLTGGGLVQRGHQIFAVFPRLAHEVLAGVVGDDHNRFEYVPVWTAEHGCVGQFPEEGRSGVLHLMRALRRRGLDRVGPWQSVYLHGGWIYTSELNAPAAQIWENIADEIDGGATHLTGGRAGWA